ncbi:helicase C-terminal domain-containing protein [Coraliomargarita algicola]|uniref:Helicase C-terminal domain-containing protein n=1 Tax=Coraliomargarita algicola TaxID=3092156 RepID=A0ABZ0RS29_9BACT|nr:helicase C-terminal domain-containing protein [Coraliomargarita sp. J2-16]WPJ95764.1 helicase C-terminal domain-containing protein [Coraliomargarita sp. J2-16]
MQIDPMQRCVRLSVRELAIFRNQPSARGHGHSPWRAAVGQQWHKSAEAMSHAEHSDARFEVSVNANWQHRDWLFKISGRIDQLLPTTHGFLIREVKTIRSPLPAPDETLIADYSDYFAQAATYRSMLELLPEFSDQTITAEGQFINIENGAKQSVLLQSSEHALFEYQLEQLRPFLDERRSSLNRLRNAQIQAAFQTLRPGQAQLFQTLHQSALQARVVLTQAPTGFGKTGIILEHALKHMQDGLYDRCIYLSSKSTGQLETIRQLQQMIGHEMRYIQMRNRNEHRIDSERHSCTGDGRCDLEIDPHWQAAELQIDELFQNGTLDLPRAKEIGAETGICPYSITKACLPFAEIWIGDSNYIFSPDSRSVFLDALSFDAERTLLIVDEAHNLPERTADSLSIELSSPDLLFAIEELRDHGAPRNLLATANELCRWIDSLSPEQALTGNQLYMGQDLCEDFANQLTSAAFDYEATAPFAIQLIWSIPQLAESFAAPAHQFLHWAPRAGLLRATCLDASEWIAECLKPFGGCVMMSATLAPFDCFRESCGLAKDAVTVAQAQAPWRDEAYNVAIDCRVDTRLRTRERYYETTARTVAEFSYHSPGVPIVVFFASYQYAENIQTYLAALAPELRVQRQPRGVDLAEQSSFIAECLLTVDVIFLILGSSFAEGIDQLGGAVDHIMIVGPALPEVNLIQKTRIENHAGFSREDAFQDIYIRPAMRRIHQALGRIVRAPGQSARVLLHCRRFAENAYLHELAPEYQSEYQLHNDEALSLWLEA